MKSLPLEINKRFGSLIVLNPLLIVNKRTCVLVKCDCGKTRIVQKAHLMCGDTVSCGCLRVGRAKFKLTLKDNRCNHSLYSIYSSMLARCYNKRNISYPNYGGRGITVCEEWRNDFWKFVIDMGERPSKNHTIERLDNEGSYSKLNCCWATYKEQAANKRPYIPNKVLGTQTAVTETA